MRPTFDIDALRAIVVGTELRSFARAATQLGRSQSAISMQLKRLAEQAGQPLFRRTGRGLTPTEAGEALLSYARRIIALHDEAAVLVGATASAASIRLGLPQDFFEDIMPDAISRFGRTHPDVHVEVRAGRNFALAQAVQEGQIDAAIAFFEVGAERHGHRLASLPLHWFGPRSLLRAPVPDPVPLVLFDHPCLFRQAALRTLDHRRVRWRLALTTPSLPGVWSALRMCQGISVRTPYRVPTGIVDVGSHLRLPKLPLIEIRMLTAHAPSPLAAALSAALAAAVQQNLKRCAGVRF